jgi:hypothetical protein
MLPVIAILALNRPSTTASMRCRNFTTSRSLKSQNSAMLWPGQIWEMARELMQLADVIHLKAWMQENARQGQTPPLLINPQALRYASEFLIVQT